MTVKTLEDWKECAEEWEQLAYRYQDERDALEAHVERLREGMHQALVHWGPHCTDEDGIAYAECEKRCDETPATSLASLKADGVRDAANHILSMGSDTHKGILHHDRYMYISSRALKEYADQLRRQAEEGTS